MLLTLLHRYLFGILDKIDHLLQLVSMSHLSLLALTLELLVLLGHFSRVLRYLTEFRGQLFDLLPQSALRLNSVLDRVLLHSLHRLCKHGDLPSETLTVLQLLVEGCL